MQNSKERVIAYVDGFNLYFGLKSAYNRKYLWLDLWKLTNKSLKSDQVLVQLKYFSSRLTNSPEKERRQNLFIEALQTNANIKLFFGKYQKTEIHCFSCGQIRDSYNEKMTDVNIAVEILSDAFRDNFDTAILISGDADLTPVIRSLKSLFKEKKIIVAFPPKRKNKSISQVADESSIIKKQDIRHCLLPNKIIKKDGFILKRPDKWR